MAPHELAIKRVIIAFASLRKTSYKNGNYLNKKPCWTLAEENCLFHGKKRIKLGKQSSRGQEAQFHVLQYTSHSFMQMAWTILPLDGENGRGPVVFVLFLKL